MDTKRICKQCRKPLPQNSPEGLCPECLARVALGSEPAAPGSRVPPAPAELAAQFPQLEIIELLGMGGMGMVYKARQPRLDRLVALKILPIDSTPDASFAERFEREAKALAKLNHPGIVTLYDFGQTRQYYYFVMEYVDGMNLRQLIQAKSLEPRQALELVTQICTALQFAHDGKIVHRDIKPENILITKKGQVKIADFGLAKLLGGQPDTALTASQMVMGTLNYMAPEQREKPLEVDHRADIYSLGVVFYEMLTGEVPMGRFQPPSKKVQVDVRLDEVVLRALEREPERRYQQASQVKTAVQTIAGYPGWPHTASSQQGVEYRSRATLFGLPLLHVATGTDPATGRARVARGVIAIGGIAQGVVAFGGVAMGGLTFGGLSLGVIAFGGCALGLVAFGGLAVALLVAFGGAAVAPIAIGGGAIGYLASGGGVLGVHPLGANASDEIARHFFMPWAAPAMSLAIAVLPLLLVLLMTVMLGVPLWLRRRALNNSSISPAQPFPGRSRGVNRGEPAPAAAKTTTEPLPPSGKAVAVQLRGTFTPAELDALTQSLTPAQKAAFQTQFAAAKKERGTAITLSVIPIVGNFGIGRFYLGQTGLGILHIVLMMAFLIPGIIYWMVDWFIIGRACDNYNREKAREIAVLVKSLG